MAVPSEAIFQTNGILASLEQQDRALVHPLLTEVDLPFRTMLETAFRKISHVYFPQSGIASVIAVSKHERRQTEAGLTGFEGMTGIAVVLGVDRSPSNAMMQIAGRGLRIEVKDLRGAMVQSITLRDAFTRFAHVFGVQCTHTALSNARGSIAERLARWLLMVHDRTDGDNLSLTHELISVMVGARRAGVSTALGEFEDDKLIRIHRRNVTVLDRKGLEVAADGLYGVPEDEYKRLFSA